MYILVIAATNSGDLTNTASSTGAAKLEKKMELLTNMAPMLQYGFCDDGYGNLVRVLAPSWSAAYYHVHGR